MFLLRQKFHSIAFVFTLLFSLPASAEETILSFVSQISINPDASLDVREEIRVTAEGRNIRRGIFRDFPTIYKDRTGNRVRVGFDVSEVLRNGNPEPYAIESISNGKRVRIGSADRFLSDGIHTYTIVYRTTRQLGFFDGFDELYWNVTGNGWAFPIEQAAAIIALPDRAPLLEYDAYTGPQGAQGKDFEKTVLVDGRISFSTTRVLAPEEGLTIAASWPKGFVTAPTRGDEARFFLQDNAPVVVAFLGFLAVLSHYLYAWHHFGRDPETGTIFPRFSPPDGFSPAASRFVMRMGYDRIGFAVAVINMAVKGYLKIAENDKSFVLTRLSDDRSRLSNGESRISKALFGRANSIVLDQKNHSRISKAIGTLKESLEREYQQKYFATNARYFYIGAALTVAVALAMALVSDMPVESVFMTIWLSLWSVGTILLAGQVVNRWRTLRSGPGSAFGNAVSAMAMTLFAMPFFVGELAVLTFIGFSVSFTAISIVAVMIVVNGVFFYLLRAPTLAGAKIRDDLNGFKMYLETAERERLAAMYPPKMTPELFERFLPYALALGVEQRWSEQFAAQMPTAKEKNVPYHPAWYSGSNWDQFGAANFAQSVGSSLASAAASASTAPGSSSGSGGGGSSGGGGGGGGGGGW